MVIAASSTFHLTNSSKRNVGNTDCRKLKFRIRRIDIRHDVHTPSQWPRGLRRLVAGIAVSNPARGMDVCLLCLYECRNLTFRIWVIDVWHDVHTKFHEFTFCLGLNIKYVQTDISF
jgi:hypothetical protein